MGPRLRGDDGGNVGAAPSSPRRRGPIRRVADVLVGISGLVERPLCNHDRQGLWVPAFAGTTEGMLVRHRRPREGGDPYAVWPMFWLALVALLNGLTAIMTARGYGSRLS